MCLVQRGLPGVRPGPALLGQPDFGPEADGPRPAAPLIVRRGGPHPARRGGHRRRARRVWNARHRSRNIGGRPSSTRGRRSAGTLRDAARAPNRAGWNALLEYYAHALEAADNVDVRLGTVVSAELLDGFDEIVVALGSVEVLPGPAGSSGRSMRRPSSARACPCRRRRLVVVDDGFGWWPCASAVETGIAGGFGQRHSPQPRSAFGSRLPPEGNVQLLRRLPARLSRSAR